MGINLGILGGLGRGTMTGLQQAAEVKNADARRQLMELEIARQKEDAADRKAMADTAGQLDTVKAGIRSKEEARNAALTEGVSQGNADKALATDVKDAIATTGEAPSALAAGMLSPAPGIGSITGPATPTGIAAAEKAAPAKRMDNLADTKPNKSVDAQTQKLDDATVSGMAWKELAPKMASIYMKRGKVEEAHKIMKYANDEEMARYSHTWASMMSDMALGAYDTAAGKAAALYNMNYPDGKMVNVSKAGDGMFKIDQYDEKTGKLLGSKVIGTEELKMLGEQSLSPAERVKLMIEDKRQAGKEKHELKVADRQLMAQKFKDDSDRRREDNKFAITQTLEEGRDRRMTQALASRERNADVVAGGRPDPEIKQANEVANFIEKHVAGLTPKNSKGPYDADARAWLASRTTELAGKNPSKADILKYAGQAQQEWATADNIGQQSGAAYKKELDKGPKSGEFSKSSAERTAEAKRVGTDYRNQNLPSGKPTDKPAAAAPRDAAKPANAKPKFKFNDLPQ
jgi:hypothetical protein